ncbi:COG4705 family protein [Cellulomonas sp. ICMP 17802]|uniref:COG4705 family protein n=1 Tax=Cellulomonas sp. ICMP 17802 TaxID=3239199 RepID=UPI00351B47C9
MTTSEPTATRSTTSLTDAASKVPEVTAIFWAAKALTTAMGESSSDFLVRAMPPELAVLLGAAALGVALVLQLRAPRYVPWRYWLAVSMVGVFGTMAADVVHVGLGIPYEVSTAFFAVTLAAVFVLWHRTEGTLSIHSIRTARREWFYWAAVMATFALGTAAGDLLAVTFHLGYLAAGLVFSVLLLVPAIGYRWFGLNAILAFWWAYVLTRPVGASFADWLGVSPDRGGLGLGSGRVALVLAVAIAALVVRMTSADRAERQRLA